MEDENTYKYTLFLDKRDLGIVQPDRTYAPTNDKDFFVPFTLYRSLKLESEYVETFIDPFRASIDRQLINPFYIEMGFFETIQHITGNTQYDNVINKAEKFQITINK